MAASLKRGQLLPGSRSQLLEQIGEALLIQQRLAGRVDMADRPDVLWDHPDLCVGIKHAHIMTDGEPGAVLGRDDEAEGPTREVGNHYGPCHVLRVTQGGSRGMATRTTLNVSLPVELGRFVEKLVSEGHYASASEVVRAAVRLLRERESNLSQDQADLGTERPKEEVGAR